MNIPAEHGTQTPNLTVFERVVQNAPEEHLYLSERHKVLMAVDPFAKLPLQSVIAPTKGTPGQESHFDELPFRAQLKLHTASSYLGKKMLELCEPGERVIKHIEGFAVSDHPHIVTYVAERGQGRDLYDGSFIGAAAVALATEQLRLDEHEVDELDEILTRIDKL